MSSPGAECTRSHSRSAIISYAHRASGITATVTVDQKAGSSASLWSCVKATRAPQSVTYSPMLDLLLFMENPSRFDKRRRKPQDKKRAPRRRKRSNSFSKLNPARSHDANRGSCHRTRAAVLNGVDACIIFPQHRLHQSKWTTSQSAPPVGIFGNLLADDLIGNHTPASGQRDLWRLFATTRFPLACRSVLSARSLQEGTKGASG